MAHLTEHIITLMDKTGFPEEAKKEVARVEKKLDDNPSFAEKFDKIVHDYMYPEAEGMHEAIEALDALAPEVEENSYVLQLVFLLNNTEELLRRYRAKGISDDIYWDTMTDIRCKLIECMDCEGVCGIFVTGWYDGFFKETRYAYGRFQYEWSLFGEDEPYTTKCGLVLEKGMPVVNFHIPSSGIPLTDEVRLDSYKRAYEQVKDQFNGGPVIFECSSWLLFPKHKEFLPKHLNILKFMDDFEIIRSKENDEFSNGWRVFGAKSDLPPEQWPTDTALRKAYADWVLAGNKTGSGYGIIVFDGEKILR